MRRFLAALSFVALLPRASFADYHEDLETASPSGAFRFEAKSPDNAAGKRENQGHFEYSMVDTSTGKTLWTRKQPDAEVRGYREAPPKSIHAGDDGMAVVCTDDEEIFLIDTTGKKKCPFYIDTYLPLRECAEFTENAHRPQFWDGNSRWYFLGVKSGEKTLPYFVIRLYWGRRIVIDVGTWKVLSDEGVTDELLAAAKAAEEKWVRDLIGRYAKEAEKSKYLFSNMERGSYANRRLLECAVFLAGAMDLRSEAGALRKLEKCHSSGSFGMMANRAISTHQDSLRQTCQTALRRLGETPREESGLTLTVGRNGNEKKLESDVLPKKRAGRADEVAKGMKIEDVIERVGFPDYNLHSRGNCLEYDVDAESPFTLRVYFDETFESVQWIQRLDPPAWKKISKRDNGSAW